MHKKLKKSIACNLTNHRTGKVPFLKNFCHLSLPPFLNNKQHAFLAFTEQQLPCLHIFLSCRNLIKVYAHAYLAFCTHLRCRANDPCCAHILHTNYCTCLNDFETSLE